MQILTIISSWKVSGNRRKVYVKNSKKGSQGSHGKIGKQTYVEYGRQKSSANGLLTNPPSHNIFHLTTENCTLQIQRKIQVLFVHHTPRPVSPSPTCWHSQVLRPGVPRHRPTFSHNRLSPGLSIVRIV